MVKFNKALVASAVMLAVSSSVALASGGYYAPPVAPAPEYFNGFYVGIDVSRDVAAFSVDHGSALVTDIAVAIDDTASIFADNVLATRHQGNIGLQGINGEIFVGYSRTWNNFFLGGEIFGYVSSAKASSNTETFDDLDVVAIDAAGAVVATAGATAAISSDIEVKMPYGFGVSLLPGIKLNDSALLYGRVGYVWSQVEVNQNGHFFVGTDDADLNTAFDFAGFASGENNHNKGRSGFQLGAGMEIAMNANWSIRGEYDHVWYNSFDNRTSHFVPNLSTFIDGDEVDLAVGSSFVTANQLKPQSDQFKLGVIYRFPA